MNLKNERKDTVYKYDIDCSDEELLKLKKLAVERFAKDEQAQVEYAVLTILKDAVDKLTADKLLLAAGKAKRVKKEKANGNKNKRRK
jgi:hypothetical protein